MDLLRTYGKQEEELDFTYYAASRGTSFVRLERVDFGAAGIKSDSAGLENGVLGRIKWKSAIWRYVMQVCIT